MSTRAPRLEASYGRWTVIGRPANLRVRCRCECGTERNVYLSNLKRGLSRGCGPACPTLGVRYRALPEYGPWYMMVYRCTKPHAPDYPRWGGSGITVCDRWLDFKAFLADMGPRPSLKHSLDRIDNRGNYEPGNVRWATVQEQGSNRDNNTRLTLAGETLTVAQWAHRAGLPVNTMLNRLNRGWGLARAVRTQPGMAEMSPYAFAVLSALIRQGESIARDLRPDVEMERSTAYKALQRLGARGFATSRRVGPRRLWRATEKGRTMARHWLE